MSADLYTKAFPNTPEWQLATRLINHLDPELFWGGRRPSKAHVMPVEHKGGLLFDYWVANPWLNHEIKVLLASPGCVRGERCQRSDSSSFVDVPATSIPPVRAPGGLDVGHTQDLNTPLSTDKMPEGMNTDACEVPFPSEEETSDVQMPPGPTSQQNGGEERR